MNKGAFYRGVASEASHGIQYVYGIPLLPFRWRLLDSVGPSKEIYKNKNRSIRLKLDSFDERIYICERKNVKKNNYQKLHHPVHVRMCRLIVSVVSRKSVSRRKADCELTGLEIKGGLVFMCVCVSEKPPLTTSRHFPNKYPVDKLNYKRFSFR